MRYVPTDPAPAPAVAVRRAVHDLRAEAERRAWASRPLRYAPTSGDIGGHPDDPAGAAPDPLVGLLAQLRAVTTRYVCGLRADGARPEQMLVQVKTFVREAMAAEGWADPEAVRALTAEVVRLSIAAYYDE